MKNKILVLFCLAFLLVGAGNLASYQETQVAYSAYGAGSGSSFGLVQRQECVQGQDFVIQVAPFGCEPAVVRSDLLEEQDVAVFCQLYATKINPLIDVKAIKNIDFVGTMPEGVRDIGFFPSRFALGENSLALDSPVLDNIGYAVIVLQQQKNSSAFKDCGDGVCWIGGNLTARINYDIENAFGVGAASFYLREMSDANWDQKLAQYSFWNGKGFLRAENIDSTSATIKVYDQSLRETNSFNLDRGETSNEAYLPGFDCLAGMRVKLDSLVSPTTTAKLEVNGETLELRSGETFDDGKCRLNSIKKIGLIDEVSIRCEDEGSFTLRKYPLVDLNINGNVGEYEVGDFLYSYTDDAEERFVYLGYAGTKGNTGAEQDLDVLLVELPNVYKEKLNDEDLWAAKAIAEGERWDAAAGKANIINFGKQVLGVVSGTTLNAWKWLVDGQHYTSLSLEESKTVGDKSVIFEGMASPKNYDLKAETETYYKKALEDYDSIIENFKSSVYPDSSSESLGEKAYFGKIKTAAVLLQWDDVQRFCEDFYSDFDNGDLKKQADKYCGDFVAQSSSGVSTYDAFVDNEVKEISFLGSREPSFNEFGATINVRTSNGTTFDVNLLKDEVYYLGQGEGFIQLTGLEVNSAKVRVSLDKSFFSNVKDVVVNDVETLILKQPDTFGSQYSFTLTRVNLKKVAQVSVKPSIDYQGSEAPFSFKIGVEQRGIQLAPEKIESKVKTLESSIAELEDLSGKLGSLVTGLKTACFATNAVLIIKNFLGNLDGKAIARQKVMRGSGGWYERCTTLATNGTYSTVDGCISSNAGKIDDEVDSVAKTLKDQNDLISQIQSKYEKGGILGDSVVDSSGFEKEYLEKIKEQGLLSKLKSKFGGNSVRIGNDDVDLEDFVNRLNSSNIPFDKIRELDLYSKLDNGEGLNEFSLSNLKGTVGDISVNTAKINKIEDVASSLGLKPEDISYIEEEKSVPKPYSGKKYGDIKNEVALEGVNDSTPVQVVTRSAIEYVATLKKYGDKYSIENLYLFNGTEVDKDRLRGVYFILYDSGSYEHQYTGSSSSKNGEPVIKYYETAPYAGLPALVPFDLKEGWYASVDQTLGVLGNTESYTKGGRVQSFYVCNVGKNGIEENRKNDDICRLVNTYTGEAYNAFPGLDPNKAKDVIKDAAQAIEQASTQHGKSEVLINVGRGKVVVKNGEPAVSVPEVECYDIMSVADCKILFNVCDPVICPSSRCDLGGKYPVADVVQSGIIGSIALCAPNWVGFGGDIYVPVCLSGVKAGLDGWISVQKSYRDCLQQNLDTGETVGICDEIHSIYQCEFFWRQGLPLANLAIPRALEFAKGQSSAKGGGEYLGVQSAWDNAGKSVDYFTQYYAENSFNAFKARSTEEAGSELCKVYVSGVLPTSADGFANLVQPDSPSQFTGWFDEIPYTSVTNPPVSQYKVFYHIYAGDDSGVQYRVYLKGSADSSFYQDTSNSYQVANGYIAPGEYASETRDFTAVAGYKQLCIMVNDQLECGFGEVTTDFGLNYLKEKGVAEMAKDNVSSTKECVSGSANIYTILNPQNPQEKVEETLTGAEIYNSGVTRICASDNPGSATDPERWKYVGTCDDEGMECWLDTQSVENAIKNAGLEQDVLSEAEKKTTQFLQDQNYYLKRDEFDSAVKEIKGTPAEKIEQITKLFDKVVYNNQKAYLLFLRGGNYMKDALSSLMSYFSIVLDEPIGGGETAGGIAGGGIGVSGNSIWQTANNLIAANYDTQRILTSDEINKSYTCARFVAEVLIKSGISGFSLPEKGICALDSVESMVKILAQRDDFVGVTDLNALQKGDLVAFKWYEGGQHMTIFDSYDSDNSNVVYVFGDGGSDVPAAKQKFTLGNKGYIWKAYRYVGGDAGGFGESSSGASGVFDSPVFKFSDGKAFSGDMYFRYDGSKWEWTRLIDEGNWFPAQPFNFSELEDYARTNNLEVPNELSNVDKATMKALQNADYKEGITVLVSRVVKNSEGGGLWNVAKYGLAYFSGDKIKLSNLEDTLEFDSDTIVTKEDQMAGSNGVTLRYWIYFYYDQSKNEWQWSFEKKNWKSTSSVSVNDFTSQNEYDYFKSEYFTKLSQLGFYEGIMFLFDPSAEIYYDFEPSISARDCDGVFTLDQAGSFSTIYFAYDGGWRWSFKPDGEIDSETLQNPWLDFTQTSVQTIEGNPLLFGKNILGLSQELVGAGCEDGAELINYYSEQRDSRRNWREEGLGRVIDTLDYLMGVFGNVKYSDKVLVKNFIDELHTDGVIDDDFYKEVNGEGIFNSEEDLEYVRDFLIIQKNFEEVMADYGKADFGSIPMSEMFVFHQNSVGSPDIYFAFNNLSNSWFWSFDRNNWYDVFVVENIMNDSQKRQYLGMLLDDFSRAQFILNLQGRDEVSGRNLIIGSGGEKIGGF